MITSAIFSRDGDRRDQRFAPLPLTAVKPRGWLLEQLKRCAAGITGQLHKFWPDVRDSAWCGGDGDAWERAPYYLDGLVPLAYLLDDAELIAVAKKYIEWTLGSQREDGQFGPSSNDDWWPRMVMLKALMQYYTATADRRVPEMMLRYFAYQNKTIDEKPLVDWAVARAAENIHAAMWLYNLTGRKFLKDLCAKLWAQSLDWTGHFYAFPHTQPMARAIPWREMREKREQEGAGLRGVNHPYYAAQYHLSHVVNVAMGLKAPGVVSQFKSGAKEYEAFTVGYWKLMRHHGVANGMFTGDEHLNGPGPTQGTECCAVVELMHTIETLIGIGAQVDIDLLEKLAFNALPATLTADVTGHQYLQQANQIKCSVDKRNWYNNGDDSNIYGLEPNFGCCTANLHQGWPKYAANLWYAADGGGFAAISYAPCAVNFWSDRVPVRFTVDTAYPYEEIVRIRVETGRPIKFPLQLWVPRWAEGARCTLPGGERVTLEAGGFAAIDREWKAGDVIELNLPMAPRITRWSRKSAAVELGPLLMAFQPGERWTKLVEREQVCDWAVEPTTDWNWALVEGGMAVERDPAAVAPFGHGNAVKVRARAAQLPQWGMDGANCAPTPIEPRVKAADVTQIELVPYGGTGLRISQFPLATVEEIQ
ncbi:MAG: hypothetical protein GX558_07195 [Clostridiales bacterium]|nr:hypothetical protein [Clostridiales bacterium]